MNTLHASGFDLPWWLDLLIRYPWLLLLIPAAIVLSIVVARKRKK